MNSYLLNSDGYIIAEYIGKEIDGWFHSELRIDSTCYKITNGEPEYLPLVKRGILNSNNILEKIYETRKDDSNPIIPDGITIGYKYENGNFVITTELFNSLKQEKINEINAAAELEIISGIYSNALGSMHRYDSDLVDQLNFQQAKDLAQKKHEEYLIAKQTNPDATEQPVYYRIWNTDDVTKGWYPHTYNQFEQVLEDGATAKSTILLKCSNLKGQIEAVTTLEQLDAIQW